MVLKVFCVPRWLVMCSILTGCANLPAPPSEPARAEWGRVVVVPARYPPQSNIRIFAVGKGAGAGKGAVAGSATGVAGTGAFAAAGALEAVIAPYLAVVMVPAMAAGGAYLGGQAAMSDQDAAALEGSVRRNLTTLQVPGTLARAISETAEQDAGRRLPLLADAGPAAPESLPGYGALARQTDSVLEVVATQVGFSGGKRLRFYLVARIRVVRVSDSMQLYQREFVYQSDEYRARLWGENQAALFQVELQRAYASLADSVVEQLFLLTELPQVSHAGAGGRAGPGDLTDLLVGRDACGLAWVSPPRVFHPTITDVDHRDWNGFPLVTGDRPTLVWESFPRDIDRKALAGRELSAITNVRYDLRVWQVVADAPPRLIYQRRDLPAPSHTLEQPLAPKGRYFWSARARFGLAGAVRGTKWGYFRVPSYETSGMHSKVKPELSPAAVLGPFLAGAAPRDVCTLDFVPTSNYYRFQIP